MIAQLPPATGWKSTYTPASIALAKAETIAAVNRIIDSTEKSQLLEHRDNDHVVSALMGAFNELRQDLALKYS